jgi:hypothetical protein
MAVVHLKNAYSASVCGRATKLFTGTHSEVTCKQCLRSIAAAWKKAHEEEMYGAGLARLAELAEEERKRLPRGPSVGGGRRLRIIYAIETKVVGVTHPNEDGSERQTIIQRCVIGEELKLVRESQCPFDPAAICVFRMNGEQLGYLSRELSGGGTAAKLDSGETFHCYITNIAGGYDGRSFGVNVQVSNSDRQEHQVPFCGRSFPAQLFRTR